MSKEKRKHPRLRVHLPVHAQVGGDVQALDVADISPSGMQIRSLDFEKLKTSFDPHRNRAAFEIQITARLAWAQNNPSGDFLTGWEFVIERGPEAQKVDVPKDQTDKRKHRRMALQIPIRAQVGSGDFQAIELVDISPSGMQLRCRDFEPIRAGLGAKTNHAEFTLELMARLAWVQTDEEGEYLTGWEFELDADRTSVD